MITIRKSEERGHFNYDWLETYHTFSFGDYEDPRFHGFRALRVINEDRVQPGQGFPPHSHQNMEIITYLLSGALEHKDSLGNRFVISPGEIQRMTAGSGITHSETNASDKEEVHLLQIWILPNKKGLKPGYEQKKFPLSDWVNQLKPIVSPDGRDGSLKIHQDAAVYGGKMNGNIKVSYALKKGRHAWIQVSRGKLEINGHTLEQGDGAAVSDESQIIFQSNQGAELLLFDLA